MKTPIFYKLAVAAFVASLCFASASALAGPDASQQQMIQQVMKAKQKLKEAEAAKGAERQKLMSEHMKMMQDAMKQMQAMQPKAGMSMKEHEDWISEHQKLMSQMMEQMMQEHHMVMGMDKCPMMDMGDMHK